MSAQLTGVRTIPGNYATITAAVADLNTVGVGTGGVIFNIAAGYTETISATISLTATGTLANPIVFQKNPSTSGANPLITAYTNGIATSASSIQDGIWRLVGSDYVTIDGIDLRENPVNTANPATMEYGYALYKASTSNGCQNVTIQRCVITLNRVNNGSGSSQIVDGATGIIAVNTTATAAATVLTPVAGGVHSFNRFYSNTIQNCNNGIVLIGYAAVSPFTLSDFNNDIGGTSAATGNTILNYGGGSGAALSAMGVRTLAQQALNVSYNTIRNNNGSGVNHPVGLRGIYLGAATSASSTITYNNITISGGGTTQTISGIDNLAGATPAGNTITISNNSVVNSTYSSATTGGFYGILNNAASAAVVLMTNNTVTGNTTSATSTGFIYSIMNSGAATSVSITNNTVSDISGGATTTGLNVGVYNSGAAGTLNITNNLITGLTVNSATGVCYGIYNTATVTSAINISANEFGTSTLPAARFNVANSGAQRSIYNTKGGTAATLTISNNNIYNYLYQVAGTGANTYIGNSAATLQQTINGNTFNNLNINTAGGITLLASSATVPASGVQNISSNSIVGSFTKAPTGTLVCLSSSGTTAANSVVNYTGNNFSNITVTGTTAVTGLSNTDAGSATKTISNNTFSNWVAGTGQMTGISVNLTSANNSTTGNTISNFSGGGTVYGILTSAGNDRISANTITGLSTSGVSTVVGIQVSSGTTKNVFGNKIYNLSGSNASSVVYGIGISGSSTAGVVTANVYNNLISDLRTPVANNAESIRGISITSTRTTSTINISYNTIYLNATSTSALFGSSGIFHAGSTTSSTTLLNLRNNIVINLSTPAGTGLTVALRRATSLSNFSTVSDYNLYYAGTAGASRLIYYDGNSDQTMATYRARVNPREVNSVTEDLVSNLKFLSTNGASPQFLHLDPLKPNLAEGGGISISTITTDVDGQFRQGSAGYSGTGNAPDIGADEFEGVEGGGLAGTVLVGTGEAITSLTNAGGLFANINSLGLSGNVVVRITSNLSETGINLLNAWSEQGVGGYTLTITPDASTMRTISGTVTTGMIRFSGARRVTIDGSNGTSSNYLTFSNAGGATGPAIIFLNGASNNRISYSNIEAYGNATNGTILFGTSTDPAGNSNNTISFCNISAAISTNVGIVGIYSAGTAGSENINNILTNNRIYNFRERAIDIAATGSSAWNIANNSLYNGDVSATAAYAAGTAIHGIRILGGAGYIVNRNFIGGNAELAGGTIAAYNSADIISYQGILLNTTNALPASSITGNRIANIGMSVVPVSTTAATVFTGIETNGSGINIGGNLAGDGNIIGSNTVNGSIQITTTTTVATYLSNIRGITCNSTGGVIWGNQVGGMDINNQGTTVAVAGPSTMHGIYVNSATAPSQVNNNIIGSSGSGAATNSVRVIAASASTRTSLTGIGLGPLVASTVQIDANLVQNVSILNSANPTVANGGFTGIGSAASGAAVVSITNNNISSNSITNFTTGIFNGISNTGTPASLSMDYNTLLANNSASTTGTYTAISNTGITANALTINYNNIGSSAGASFIFSAANSGTQSLIVNSAGSATSSVAISNNNFENLNFAVTSSAAVNFITNTAATFSQTINGNTFTNLDVNTTGSITFITNSVALPAGGTQNVNNNSVVTAFTKRAGGTLTLFTNTAASANSVINNNSNNFSNITVPGATNIAGWVNTDAGTPTKTIQNNIFSNWSAGSGTVTALNISLTGATNSITGNQINNISGSGTLTGINSNAGSNNIFSNIINTLNSTGAVTVTGISLTGGNVQNVYKNKIYDLTANNAGGMVYGISVSGTAFVTTNIYNNLIGDLKTPASNLAESIRGISITSTAVNSVNNVYFNTIYLNATSSAALFGSSGIYHTANATATTAALNLRNNSITNISTPKGAGTTVAFRRSAVALNNYSSTSNNNLFYAGTAGLTRLLYTDGVTSDLTMTTYKLRVTTRDAASVTENLAGKYLSTTGSSAVFLHMDAAQPTLIESGAVNIAGFTDDYDGQVRAGNTGYSGTDVTPDIGADEVSGIEVIPPTISYTPLTDTTSVNNRAISGIVITDASGVNINNGTRPRIYYKRLTDANVWLDNTSNTNGWKFTEATNTASPFTFTINYALLYGGASVTAGVIQYFIVAQDLSTVANTAVNSGTLSTTPSGVALSAAAFPVTGTINSFKIPFSGTYNVGQAQVYTSLTKADGFFSAINSAGLMGNTTFNITSDLTEDGVTALNQWAESGAGNYTLTIQPGSAISRNITGSVAGPLITLNGADRVTINGSVAGAGVYLHFINNNTTGTTATAFTFQAGATNNKIRFCEAVAVGNSTNGVITFGAGGNSNNLITSSQINGTVSSSTGVVGVYSNGGAGTPNLADTISNSTIFNYSDRGVDLPASGSSAWVINGNSIYNGAVTDALNYTAGADLQGIRINGGSGYQVLNNYIGGRAVQAGGTNAKYESTTGNVSYQGIAITTTSASPQSNVTGNRIGAINIVSLPSAPNTNAFTGINVSGSGINIGGTLAADGNVIGSTTVLGNINVTTTTTSSDNNSIVAGITSAGSGGIISNNQVGGISISNLGSAPAPTNFQGIYFNNAAAPTAVSNNMIGSRTISGSIRFNANSLAVNPSLTGIEIGAAVNSAITMNANLVARISNLSTTSSGIFRGINNNAVSSGAVITMSADTVQFITTAANSNAGSGIYYGINTNSPTTISNGLIGDFNLASTGVNSQLIGIRVAGNFAHTISGNDLIRLVSSSQKVTAAIESTTPESAAIIGLLHSATAAGQVIRNNRFVNFTQSSATAANTAVVGVAVTTASSGVIFNNRFGSYSNLGTGSAPTLCDIVAASGSYNVYNNSLRLSNLTNTNPVKLYGFLHTSATGWNYFHNSVNISGSSAATTLRSAAFVLTANSALNIKNNIFFNTRKGGSNAYSISNLASPVTSWSSTASDYNDLYSANLNSTTEWGADNRQSFAQWKTLTGGDVRSVSVALSFLASTYDLQPDSTTNCNLDRAGTPISTPVAITTDINNITRNASTPDIGAYEFSYTGFNVKANSNSPVCAGDSLTLLSTTSALSPAFTWRNAANTVISTLPNPIVQLVAGQYKLTVTDSTGCSVSDSTTVSINQRPTGKITGQTSVCDSGFVYLSIAVTGTGTITGMYSNGEIFSGTAPVILDTIFVNTSTDLSIVALSDDNCESMDIDITDTLAIAVTHKGDWLGITNVWNSPINWCGGVVPTAATDVVIPNDATVMPVITDSARCRSILIEDGSTVTISATGVLSISGTMTNQGQYNDNGTTIFAGTTGQQTYSGVPTFNNLIVRNPLGLLVPAAVTVKRNLTLTQGLLNANGANIFISGNWINNVSATAFTGGTGTVTFTDTLSQIIGGTFSTTFTNLAVTKTINPLTLLLNTPVTGNLTINSGTFDLSTFTANRTTAGGTLTLANNSTLAIGGTNTYPTNFSTNNLQVASTVLYYGTTQTIANQLYGNLTLRSATGAAVKTSPATALVINGNLSTLVGTGTSVTLNSAAAITVNGNVSIGTGTILNGSTFTQTVAGNFLNNGTFNGNTGTLVFSGSAKTVSGPGLHNFNNLTVTGAGVLFSSDTLRLSGNLATTGSGSFVQAQGGMILMSGAAKTISGVDLSINNLSVTGSVTTAASFIVSGNIAVSGSLTAGGGTITLSGAAKTITGAGTIGFSTLNVTGTLVSSSSFSIGSGLVVAGSFTATAGTATFTGTSSLSGTANLSSVVLNGTSLTLSATSVLGIAGVFTITSGTLDVTSSGRNTVNFNGTGAQNVNAITYSSLVFSNGNTKTALGAITVNDDITIGTGTTFNPVSFTHSIYGNWVNNGIFLPATSTVRFVGAQNATLSGATTFNILTSATTNSSTLLSLLSPVTAATVNMTNGVIDTNTDTLTITNTRTGNGFIFGNITRSHTFNGGTAYAFEGPNNLITFAVPLSINKVTVSVKRGAISDFPFGASIARLYTLNVQSGGFVGATVRLHYENSELNGNNEASMAVWGNGGSSWSSVGKAGNDTVANYVEQGGLLSINGRYTLANDGNLVRWNGGTSSDWNTAANWTVVQGSGTRPPGASDIVDLGSVTFTNQPTITSAVSVRGIVFGSAKAVTLTLGTGGSLTLGGDLSGKWTASATHTINVGNQNLAVNGSIYLSDSIAGHSINLNIGSGNVSTMNSLIQHDGSSIVFTGAGTLSIYRDYRYGSGTFTRGNGTVIYNGVDNQHVAEVTYNNLTINKTGGIASIEAPITIAGNLTLSSGFVENYGNTTVGGNVSIASGSTLSNYLALNVGGNWTNNGTTIENGSEIVFNGSGTQNISASTFNNLRFNKPVGSVATLTGDVTMKGNLVGTSGTLDIKSFFFNRDVVGGSATIGDSATLIIAADNAPNKFSSYALADNSTVIFNGTTEQHLLLPGLVYGNITFRNSGTKILYTSINVKRNLTIENTATFDAGANTITLNGNWINTGTFVPSTGTVILAGTGRTVSGVTRFNKVNTTGSYTLLNDMTFGDLLNITSTGSLLGGSAISVTMEKDLINSGVLNNQGSTTFTGTVLQTLSLINAVQTVAITVNFNGTVSPILNSTSPPQYGFLNINNTGGINASVGYAILFALNIGPGASFNAGSFTHTISGTVNNNGTITSSGILLFNPATATSINLGTNFSSTGRVYFSGAGAITLAGASTAFSNVNIENTNVAGITPPANWVLSRDLTIASGSTFNAGAGTYAIGGDILNNGTINSGTSVFTMNGNALQQIRSGSAFNNLTINKSSENVTLLNNITVQNAVNFVKGQIQTGTYSLIQPASGTLTGAGQNTGWVNGTLQKGVGTGAVSKVFEVGDLSAYVPFTVNFSNVTVPGNMSVKAIRGDHPDIQASPLDSSKSVNRYWSVTNIGLTFNNFEAGIRYLASDIDNGAISSAFGVGVYNGSSWMIPASQSPTDTSIRALAVPVMGDFAVGQICNANTTIRYVDSIYCTNGGTAAVTRTGSTGGTFTSSTGLSINSTTGAVNLAASTPGDYLVTYQLAATLGCPVYSATARIVITAAPVAAISYSGTPFCASSPNGAVTLTGRTGGIFSSTTGLVINASNGTLNIAASTPGNYTVTYTIAAALGCAVYTTTTNVTITTPSSATISYAGGPYCSSSSPVAVTRTGSAGGRYRSTAGLSIDSITGTITPASSLGGFYTISYVVPETNGCPQFTTTTSITITTAPNATINYTGSPFCAAAGTAPAVITGSQGGIFSSTAGLTINAATGEINLGSSTAGTYTITYSIAASGGCAAFSATTSVIIAVPGTWTGAISEDWTVSGNWLCGFVPVSSTNVTIPGGLSRYPNIASGMIAMNNITIQSTASVNLTGAVMMIAGTISNSGTFNATNGTIMMNGTTAQSIPAGTFTNSSIANLTVDNPAGVGLAGALNLTDVLTVTNGSLNSNGFLTLKSSAAGTARIAPVTSAAATPIAGNVTVERYVPGRRKYRLITSSVTTTPAATLVAGQEALSIWGNWQNSGNNTTPNSGNFITGGTTADGFDPQTQNPSLFTYDDVNRAYVPFTSANGKSTRLTPLKAGLAYYMFVFGDRINSIITQNPNMTVIKSTGTLLTGTQTYNSSSSMPLSNVPGRYTMLGNPYASPIDWSSVLKTNIANTYWGWDPNLSNTGGYVTVSTIGNVTVTAPFSGNTGLNQYIQSGQGFFVRTTAPSPILAIREQDKVGTYNPIAFRNGRISNTNTNDDTGLPLMAINLFYDNSDNKVLADGTVLALNSTFSTGIGNEDASKINNTGENIGILNNTEVLSIDARPKPKDKDTVFLNVSRLTKSKYTLQIFSVGMDTMNLQPYLEDNYLHSVQPLSLNDTNEVTINVNVADAASYAANRFRIVFSEIVVSPVTFLSIKATVVEKDISVDWAIKEDTSVLRYDVETSSDNGRYKKVGEVLSRSSAIAQSYQWQETNAAPGQHFYRIRVVHRNGGVSFSRVVLATVADKKSYLKVYPNPVKDYKINLYLYEIERGEYSLRIFNTRGQEIINTKADHKGGTGIIVINPGIRPPQGIYYLRIEKGNRNYSVKIYLE